MKIHYLKLCLLTASALIGLACSSRSRTPDVSDTIHKSLQQAGLKDISVKDETDKAVITLGGHVQSDDQKAQADSTAKSLAGGQVVANEIAVLPPADTSAQKTVNSDLDKGIEKNLDAALIQSNLQKHVKYDVKNGVVKLKGEVNTEAQRSATERVAAGVPNVQQVVNELQVKNQPATSTR